MMLTSSIMKEKTGIYSDHYGDQCLF